MTNEELRALAYKAASELKDALNSSNAGAIVIVYNAESCYADLVVARMDMTTAHAVMDSIIEQGVPIEPPHSEKPN